MCAAQPPAMPHPTPITLTLPLQCRHNAVTALSQCRHNAVTMPSQCGYNAVTMPPLPCHTPVTLPLHSCHTSVTRGTALPGQDAATKRLQEAMRKSGPSFIEKVMVDEDRTGQGLKWLTD